MSKHVARARDLQFEFIFAVVVGAPFGLSVSHATALPPAAALRGRT